MFNELLNAQSLNEDFRSYTQSQELFGNLFSSAGKYCLIPFDRKNLLID